MNALLENTKGSRVLVVVAHYDDESLFCGGTLLRVQPLAEKVEIVVVTGVEYTNAPPSGSVCGEKERARWRKRLDAFANVCRILVVPEPIHFGCRNLDSTGQDRSERKAEIRAEVSLKLGSLLRSGGFDLVLTHGPNGEYGHPQHKLVHETVRAECPRRSALWCFDLAGEQQVQIDRAAKVELLRFYRYRTTQASEWDPLTHPHYKNWCTDVETFKCLPSLVAGGRALKR